MITVLTYNPNTTDFGWKLDLHPDRTECTTVADLLGERRTFKVTIDGPLTHWSTEDHDQLRCIGQSLDRLLGIRRPYKEASEAPTLKLPKGKA